MNATVNLLGLLEVSDSEFNSEEGLEESPYCSFKVDSVYEKNRKRANRKVFRNIVNDLRAIEEHSKNGFRNLSKQEQINLIIEIENQSVKSLKNGSFYPREKSHYDAKIRKKVKETYEPLIKWRRS